MIAHKFIFSFPSNKNQSCGFKEQRIVFFGLEKSGRQERIAKLKTEIDDAQKRLDQLKEKQRQLEKELAEASREARNAHAVAQARPLLEATETMETELLFEKHLDEILAEKTISEIDGKIELDTLSGEAINLLIAVANRSGEREENLKKIYDLAKDGRIDSTKFNNKSLVVLMTHPQIGLAGITEGTKGVGIGNLKQKAELLTYNSGLGTLDKKAVYEEILEHDKDNLQNADKNIVKNLVTFATQINDISRLEKTLGTKVAEKTDVVEKPVPQKEKTPAEKKQTSIEGEVAITAKAAEVVSQELGRDVKLGQPKPGTSQYPIEVDGQDSGYVVEVNSRIVDGFYAPTMAIKIPGTPTEYKGFTEWGTDKIKEQLVSATKEIPNNRKVEDIDKALIELKAAGVEITDPKKPTNLTVHQYENLLTIGREMQNSIENGDNILNVIDNILDCNFQLKELFNDTDIQEIAFLVIGTKNLVWRQEKNIIFDNESLLQDKILNIKKKQLGENSPEYRRFIEKSRTEGTERSRNYSLEQRKEKYLANYKKLAKKQHYISSTLAASDNTFKERWLKTDNHKKVQHIMQSAPFGFSREQVPQKVHDIITNNAFDLTEDIDMGDIFDMMKGKFSVDKKGIPISFENDEVFIKYFDKLNKKIETNQSINDEELDQYNVMFDKIMVPCFELLDALTMLKYESKESDKEQVMEELPQDQKKIIDSLAKLCNFSERSANGWEKFLVWLAPGGKSEITMADMDGVNFKVDEGMFRRHNHPAAALKILANRKTLYTIENGRKILNAQAITEEINRLMKLGFINKFIKEQTGPGKSARPMDEILKDPTFKIRLARHQINNITQSNFSEHQMHAFQTGFILDQARQVDNQIETGLAALVKRPYFKNIVNELLEKGVPPKQIAAIQDKMLLAGGALFNTTTGEFEGGGLGTAIDIGDGWKVGIGIGIGKEGVNAGLGLSLEVFSNEDVKISLGTEIDILGAGVGAAGTVYLGKEIDLHAFVGVRWSWDSVVPTIGGGIGFSWNSQKAMQERMTESREKTDLNKIWEKWQSTPKNNIEGRFQLIQDTPEVWAKLAPIMEAYDLTKNDIVHMVEQIEEDNTSNVLERLSAPPITYIGFAMAGPIPIPHIGISFGSAKIFIPNRREISRMKEQLSDAVVSQEIDKALEKFQTSKVTSFIEWTPQIIYGRDGQLMVLDDKSKAELLNLGEWETSIESYNTALKETELELKEVSKGKYELKIQNTFDKDVEIHVDPALSEMGIIEENGKIFLLGNITDIIVSRERFTLPFAGEVGMSSMRDIITIRSIKTVEGGRDRSWIEKYENQFIQKLERARNFEIQNGAGYDPGTTGNVLKPSEVSAAVIDDLREHGQEFEKYLDQKELKEISENVAERFNAMGSMDIHAYENLPERENLYDNLKKLWKNNGFRRTVRRNIDRPDNIIREINKYSEKTNGLKNLNEKELNLAVVYFLNEHFTTLARTEKTPNRLIKKRLETRIKFIKKGLIPAFTEALIIADPSLQTAGERKKAATEIADQITDASFGKLLKKLDDKDFKYQDLQVEEIPQGAILLSGSRNLVKGKEVAAVGETVNYAKTPKAAAGALLHELGFLEGTTGEYKLNVSDPNRARIARVLFEVASPTPKEKAENFQDDVEFLHSPIALKIASLGVHALLANIDEYKGYKKLTEIYKNQELIKTPEGQKAVDNFRKLVRDIREAQAKGETFVREIPGTGLTVKIEMSNKIVHGAYSKCGNTSFYVEEFGTVTVLKANKIVGIYNESHEVIDVTQSKMFASIGIGIGFKTEKITGQREQPRKPRPTIKEPPRKPRPTRGPSDTSHTQKTETAKKPPQ